MDQKLKEQYQLKIEENKEDSNSYFNLACLQKNVLQNYQDSAKNFKKAILLQKNFSKSYYYLACLYQEYSEQFKKIKNIDKEIENNFKNAIKYKNDFSLAYNKLGLFYQKIKKYENSELNFLEAIKYQQDYSEAYLNLANLYSIKEYQQLEKAEINYYKSIQFDQNNPKAYYNLAKLYQQKNNFKNSEKYFLLTLQYQKENCSQIYYNLAQLYINDKFQQYEKAEQNYLQVIQHKQDFSDAYSEIANLYCCPYFKKYEEAEKYFLLAIQYKENNALNYFNLACLYQNENFQKYEETEKFKQAEKYYKLAIKYQKNDSQAYFNLANLYFQNNEFSIQKYEEAEKNYLLAIKYNQNYSKAYNNLACLYQNDFFKKYEESEKYYNLAIKYQENINQQQQCYENFGYLYFNYLKNFEKAQEFFQKSLQINQYNCNILLYFSQFYYYQVNYNDLSLYYAEKVLQINPNFVQAHKMLGILKIKSNPEQSLVHFNKFIKNLLENEDEDKEFKYFYNKIIKNNNKNNKNLTLLEESQQHIFEDQFYELAELKLQQALQQNNTSNQNKKQIYQTFIDLYYEHFKNPKFTLEILNKYQEICKKEKYNFSKYIQIEKICKNDQDRYQKQIQELYQKENIEQELEKYEQKEQIGQGNYGIIQKIVNTESKIEYAKKSIFLQQGNYLQESEREFENILKLQFSFPNSKIVKIHKIFQLKTNNDITLQIIMELAKSPLQQLYSKDKKMDKFLFNKLIKDTLHGLQQLYFQKIIHRDIKPANILYMNNNSFKLADFGTSRVFDDKDESVTLRGSPAYFPPEAQKHFVSGIQKLSKEDSQNIDWYGFDTYSLGITYLQVVCQIESISQFKGDLLQKLQETEDQQYYDSEVFKIIKFMIKENQTERSTPGQLIQIAKKLQFQ